jgi:hypothetical protein
MSESFHNPPAAQGQNVLELSASQTAQAKAAVNAPQMFSGLQVGFS